MVLGLLGGLAIVVVAALALGIGAGPARTPVTATTLPTGTPPGGAAATASSGSAAPAGSATTPAVLIAAGDITSCASTGDSATAKLVASMPGTVAVLGDDAYNSGSASEYAKCYDPTWGAFLDRTEPVPGNHEYMTRGAAGYFGYFGARAGDPGQPWYAYDLGTWRLYALNGNCAFIGGCGPSSPQVRWLTADLAAHPSACVLAYWHQPRFSSGRHGSDTSVAGLWDALSAAGAEIVLNGHDHDYERFAPQSDSGKADPNGITEFVVGTGGFTHYEFHMILPTSVVRDNTTFGVLRLELSAASWTSTFVPVAGKTFTDAASGTCH